MSILLQRKFVKLLQNYYEDKGCTPTRQELLNWVLLRKRTRLNYLFVPKDKMNRKFDDALGDCIEGTYTYIGYADDARTKLKVTLEGRDFICVGGYFQEVFKRRDKLTMFLFGVLSGGLGSATIWIFNFLRSSYSSFIIPYS